MKITFTTKLIAGTLSAALIATPVLAEKASQLGAIYGKDAWGAEQALKDRGFKSISSHKDRSGYVTSYWWDKRSEDCIRVSVYNDTVQSIADAKDSDCGHSDGNAAAVGAVAGLAILGAVLASKSHHREGRDYNEAQTSEFDRGYKDGLYNGQYHNYNRSEAYSHGYEKGVDERQANLDHRHHGRGGYSQVANFRDLIGTRAAGGMDELEARGFRQVDNFASGNARYSIQYRDASRQCIQVITANGRLENITDIHNHPACRLGSGGSSASSLPSDWYTRLPGAAHKFARSELEKANFRRVEKFSSGRNGTGSVWYNRSTGQCLQIIEVNRRVESAVDIRTHPKCR